MYVCVAYVFMNIINFNYFTNNFYIFNFYENIYYYKKRKKISIQNKFRY